MEENETIEQDLPVSEELTAEEYEAKQDLLKRIQRTLNKIRPYIQSDGGDVELIDFKDGIVTVSMLGACAGCGMIDVTLNDGIQAILIDEVPEVKEVRIVNNSPFGYFY